MDALADARAGTFGQQVVKLLWRDWSEQCPGLRIEDLQALVDFSTRICRENGFEKQGALIDFAEAMVKDESHPMSSDRMTMKAESVLHDLRARALYERLQALAAHQPGPAAARAGEGSQRG